MATVTQAQDKAGKYIKYNTASKMKFILHYVNDQEKTNPKLQGSVFLTDSKKAYEEFMLTKELWRKTSGRMCMHYVQSFAPGEVTPELAKQIADEFVKQKMFEGFQISYAVHTDKPHIHTHFIVNTVNTMNGQKWQLKDLKILRNVSDKLCREHGLSVLPERKSVTKSPAQKQAEWMGKGWKRETQLAVDEAVKIAVSRADFISLMKLQGYHVRWDDHKYILFTNPDGKMMRNRLFEHPQNYTKEVLEERFLENQKSLGRKEETKENVKPGIRKETFFAVEDAKNVAISKDDFIDILKSQGYEVCWDDHTYITFQKDGHRPVRNRNFYPKEAYTKEALLHKFDQNRERMEVMKGGDYQRDELFKEGEMYRGNMIYTLSSLLSGSQGSSYPHQDRIRSHSAREIEEYQKEMEKGKGLEWE